jgi:hypothetical protein
VNCSIHDLLPAKWRCAECGRLLCENCIRTIEVQRQKFFLCAICGGRTIALQNSQMTKKESGPDGFINEVFNILIYPARGSGLVTIILGALFFIVAEFFVSITIFGFFLGIILGGYLFKYYTTIVQASANGERTPPTWSEVEFFDVWDLAGTFFRTIFVCLVSFSIPLVYYLCNERRQTLFFIHCSASVSSISRWHSLLLVIMKA